MNGKGSPIEFRLREWLTCEERAEIDAHEAADTYRGHDIEAEVDMRRSAGRHAAIARKIRAVLGEPEPSPDCDHCIPADSCVMCGPKYADKDVRDGFCPACNAADWGAGPGPEPHHREDFSPRRSSTWHVVNEDGSSECCACGHVHPYEAGLLAGGR